MWMGAMARGWEFAYVPEVFFDYRVKRGGLLVSSHKWTRATEEYMARKHGMVFREAWLQLEHDRFSLKECGRNLGRLLRRRIGNRLVNPANRARER
jgi:hypothetical protein